MKRSAVIGSLAGNSFIGSKLIIDEHTSEIISSQRFIGEVTITLTVDTDKEVFLDLEKDLYYDRYKYGITKVEGYGNVKEYVRSFPPGVTTVKFKVTGVMAKFHEIHRHKMNGLGIELLLIKE